VLTREAEVEYAFEDRRDGVFKLAGRQVWVLIASAVAGFAIGFVYHSTFEPGHSRLSTYLLSGLNGIGIAVTVWLVQFAFSSGERSRFGAVLRRAPLAVELLLRALVMTVALIVVGLLLQLALFSSPEGPAAMARQWFTSELPRIAAISFGFSLIFRLSIESRQIVGKELMMSLLLGTYHRPVRRELIVMFLDIAHSTRLAEAMGEVRVHDLITRFFFDIDPPIRAYGGQVHAYVGDEAIVLWPLSDDRRKNARCIASFFAIEALIDRLAPAYEKAFGVVPAFRAGIHAGPVIVSECGESRRQLALFGDTMNVGARLCDYCKTIDERLVVSGALLAAAALPEGLSATDGRPIQVRGREEELEAFRVRRAVAAS
jgi:class 3 adenylate cyclase